MDQTELIELKDAESENILQVQVTPNIAERCRKDPAYSQALFSQLRKKNLKGVTSIKIKPVTEIRADVKNKFWLQQISTANKGLANKFWTPDEIKQFLKVVYKYKLNTDPRTLDKHKWMKISSELAKKNIKASPERCRQKWKNLLRSYKVAIDSKLHKKCSYIEEISSILYNDAPNNDSNDETFSEYEDDDDFKEDQIVNEQPRREVWTRYEILKFLKVFQKYRKNNPSYKTDKYHWNFISDKLAKEGIFKSAEKIHIKWKNLYKSYKSNYLKNRVPVKFQYFNEVKSLITGKELPEPELDDLSDNKELESNYISWSGEETLRLIEIYKEHKSQFNNLPKKAVWELISMNLQQEGIKKEAEKCKNKWKNLVRSYRRNKSDKSNSRFYFFNEMKTILEDDQGDCLNKPIMSPIINIGSEEEEDDEGEEFGEENEQSEEDDEEEQCGEENEQSEEEEEEEENESEEDIDENFEKIIIETNLDHNFSWSKEETNALINSYKNHTLIKNISSESLWKLISEDLLSKNFDLSSMDCKNMWESLLVDYKSNENQLSPLSKDISYILNNSYKVKAENKIKHHDLCKCFEQKERNKERRHVERMDTLKRKLDIEDRKVTAFEKYVKHLTE